MFMLVMSPHCKKKRFRFCVGEVDQFWVNVHLIEKLFLTDVRGVSFILQDCFILCLKNWTFQISFYTCASSAKLTSHEKNKKVLSISVSPTLFICPREVFTSSLKFKFPLHK